MGKTKLFFLLAVLTLILVFSVAVVCGQCGQQVSDEDKIDVERTEPGNNGEPLPFEPEQPGQPEGGDQAPTVNLTVVMGPNLSEADNVCFYRVQAETTGLPEPKIEWSKDDSKGAWGKDTAQVNLTEGQSYTLTCTVTNTEGTAQASITLEWGCD